MKPKTLKPAVIIAKAFDAIPVIYAGFRTIKEKMFDVSYKSEKEYRKDRAPIPGFTSADAARYFVVRWLAGYTTGKDAMPTIVDINHMRPDRVMAASYAAEHKDLLINWCAESVTESFWALDYAKLMQG
jgi:hypothetical protein